MNAKTKVDRTAQVAALRAARTAALARRGTDARGGAATQGVLVCACGGERYGLPLAGVAQVLPMRARTPVPGAGPAILGLVALSGRIVGVVGLAAALGRPGAGTQEDGHLVVLRAGAVPAALAVALAVDRVLGVAHLAEEAGAAPAAGFGNEAVSRYAAAGVGDAAPVPSGDFVVLDLPRLLRRILP